MKNKRVEVKSTKTIIKETPGFQKKDLAKYKVDILALCGFGCSYCSSNSGNYLRINWEEGLNFKAECENQLGRSVNKDDFPNITIEWSNVIETLENQIKNAPKSFLEKTNVLIFSPLTDSFSPNLVKNGTTQKVLEILLEKTSFTIRILTKNAIVGNKKWIDFFKKYPGRIKVGLSIGTSDDKLAKEMELGTSLPSARIKALSNLQDEGISTFAMLDPIFPDMLEGDKLEKLVETIDPGKCEAIWAEAYNDRFNWQIVQQQYTNNSKIYNWFTEAYSTDDNDLLSEYATDIYVRLRAHAENNGWMDKFKYLLYEKCITEKDVKRLGDFSGILFQSFDKKTGLSKNPIINKLQTLVDSAALKKVKALADDVKTELAKHQNSWVLLGMKVRDLVRSIEDEENITWNSAFGVKDLKQFCKDIIDEEYKFILRIKTAARCLKENRPDVYEAYLQDQSIEIPAYSVIYAVECKLDALKKINKYQELIKNLFDDKLSRRQIEDKIGKLLPGQTFNTNCSTDKSIEELSNEDKTKRQDHFRKQTIPNLIKLTDLAINEIDEFFDTDTENIVSIKAEFNAFVERIIDITNEHSGSPVTLI